MTLSRISNMGRFIRLIAWAKVGFLVGFLLVSFFGPAKKPTPAVIVQDSGGRSVDTSAIILLYGMVGVSTALYVYLDRRKKV